MAFRKAVKPSQRHGASPWDRPGPRQVTVAPPLCRCRWWCLCITTCGGLGPPCHEAFSGLIESQLGLCCCVFGGFVCICPAVTGVTAQIIYRDGCVLLPSYRGYDDGAQHAEVLHEAEMESYAEFLAAQKEQDLEDIRQFNMTGGRQQITFASRYTDNTLSFKIANGRLNMLSNGDYLLRSISFCRVIDARIEITGVPGKPGGSSNILVATPSASCAAQILTLFQQTGGAPTPKDMNRTKVGPSGRHEKENDDEGMDTFVVSVLLPVAKVAFAKLDTDGSGDLDEAEVRQLFVDVLGQPVEDDDFLSVFAELPTNPKHMARSRKKRATANRSHKQRPITHSGHPLQSSKRVKILGTS